MNILFSCAGRRRYLLKYFKEAGQDKNVINFGTDMQLSAPALTEADVSLQVPAVYSDDYLQILLSLCVENSIDAIISLNDLELPVLAQNKQMFEDKGIKVIVSDMKVIDLCFDKYKTAEFIASLNLNTPKTFISLFDAKDAIKGNQLSFPLVLKPRWGSGSIGIEFVDDMEELEIVYQLLKKKIRKTILSKASVGDDYILIQEKISGPEYGLDIVNNLNGDHKAVIVKQKLAMRSGETDKAITVDNSEIRTIGKTIAENTRHIANMDCDILERDGKYYVLELNPRFGGGYPFSHEAGVNVPRAIISWLNGDPEDPNDLIPEYGKMFSKCDILVEVNN